MTELTNLVYLVTISFAITNVLLIATISRLRQRIERLEGENRGIEPQKIEDEQEVNHADNATLRKACGFVEQWL